MKIAIGITGASGSIYARQLIDKLSVIEGVELHVIFSSYGKDVAKYEQEYNAILSNSSISIYDNNNMFCTIASGSSEIDAMVIVPCSSSTLARVATGTTNNLITRAADVMLKERRRLILCFRETPLSLIHIDNMKSATLAGAIVMPLIPSFYSRPSTIEEVVLTQTERIISLLGVKIDRFVFTDSKNTL